MTSNAPEIRKYHVKWKKHFEHFQATLAGFLDKQFLCDVTLVVEGQKFKAHQLVLSACSWYFKDILQDVPCFQNPIIICLQDVTALEIQGILDYMYKGEAIIAADKLPRFFETCQALNIQGLCDDQNSTATDRTANQRNSKSISNQSIQSSSPTKNDDCNQRKRRNKNIDDQYIQSKQAKLHNSSSVLHKPQLSCSSRSVTLTTPDKNLEHRSPSFNHVIQAAVQAETPSSSGHVLGESSARPSTQNISQISPDKNLEHRSPSFNHVIQATVQAEIPSSSGHVLGESSASPSTQNISQISPIKNLEHGSPSFNDLTEAAIHAEIDKSSSVLNKPPASPSKVYRSSELPNDSPASSPQNISEISPDKNLEHESPSFNDLTEAAIHAEIDKSSSVLNKSPASPSKVSRSSELHNDSPASPPQNISHISPDKNLEHGSPSFNDLTEAAIHAEIDKSSSVLNKPTASSLTEAVQQSELHKSSSALNKVPASPSKVSSSSEMLNDLPLMSSPQISLDENLVQESLTFNDVTQLSVSPYICGDETFFDNIAIETDILNSPTQSEESLVFMVKGSSNKSLDSSSESLLIISQKADIIEISDDDSVNSDATTVENSFKNELSSSNPDNKDVRNKAQVDDVEQESNDTFDLQLSLSADMQPNGRDSDSDDSEIIVRSSRIKSRFRNPILKNSIDRSEPCTANARMDNNQQVKQLRVVLYRTPLIEITDPPLPQENENSDVCSDATRTIPLAEYTDDNDSNKVASVSNIASKDLDPISLDTTERREIVTDEPKADETNGQYSKTRAPANKDVRKRLKNRVTHTIPLAENADNRYNKVASVSNIASKDLDAISLDTTERREILTDAPKADKTNGQYSKTRAPANKDVRKRLKVHFTNTVPLAENADNDSNKVASVSNIASKDLDATAEQREIVTDEPKADETNGHDSKTRTPTDEDVRSRLKIRVTKYVSDVYDSLDNVPADLRSMYCQTCRRCVDQCMFEKHIRQHAYEKLNRMRKPRQKKP